MQKESPKTPKKAVAKKAAVSKKEAAEAPQKVKKAAAKKAVAKKEAAPKTTTKKAAKDALVAATFRLTYGTRFGENVFIVGNVPQLGNDLNENALKLQYADAEHWAAEVKLNKADLSKEGLKYYYIIQHEDGSTEKSAPYYLQADELTSNIHVSDAWNYEGFVQNAFSTKVFDVLNDKVKTAKGKKAPAKKITHTFKVTAPELPGHYGIFLSGNSSDLGNWDTDNIILLSPDEHSGAWIAHISITADNHIVEYKYGIYDLNEKILVAFEEGDNRTFVTPETKPARTIINDGFLRSSN